MRAIAERARAIAKKPSVACIEWIEPLIAAGNWMPKLVAMAGGRNLFGAAGKHTPRLSWEELRAKDPDAIIIAPCGYPTAQSCENLPALAARPGWTTLRAFQSGRVLIADGNQYFNRPGPRLAESLEILAEILPPGSFQFGHEGAGWVRLQPLEHSG